MMTMNETERALRSVGYQCFALHYPILLDLRMTSDHRIATIQSLTGYTISGARTRVNRAEAIIRAGREAEAMMIIANSRRADPRAIAAARSWLAKHS
jgi:phage tail tape-measure protein